MILARDSITLVHVVEIESYTRYYLLQSSTLQPPAKPISEDPADDDDWQDSEPAYTAGSTNSLYFVDKTQYSNGTYSYSEVSLSSEYEAAKSAYNTASAAQTTANTAYDKISNLKIGGRNIYTIKDEVSGYIAASGATIAGASSTQKEKTSGWIPVDSVDSVNIQVWVPAAGTPWLGYAFYTDKDLATHIGTRPSKTGTANSIYMSMTSITVPDTARFLRVSYRSYGNDGRIKVEKGNQLTDWTPAPEDIDSDITAAQNAADTALDQSVEYIVGTQTAATGSWTGVTQDSELKVGKTIAYKLPYAGSGNASLTLTLSDGTETTAIPVYTNTSRVTTHFGANSIINMTYDGTNWRAASIPNSNNYDRRLHNNAILAATAIVKNKLIAGNDSGYNNIQAGLSFDLSYPILWASAAIAATKTAANTYEAYPSTPFSTTGTIEGGASNKMLYLKGSVSGNTFTVAASNFLTTVVPVIEDGFYYIPLGVMSSATAGYFATSNRLYAFINGAFQPVDTAAQLLAGEAMQIADSKTKTYRQATDPSLETGAVMTEGDLWIDTDDYNKTYWWDGTAWQTAETVQPNPNLIPNSGTFKGWMKRDGSARITYSTDPNDSALEVCDFESATGWVSVYSPPIKYSDVRGKTVTLSYWAKIDDWTAGDPSSASFLKISAYLLKWADTGKVVTVKYHDNTIYSATLETTTDWQFVSKTFVVQDSYFTSPSEGTIDPDNDLFAICFQKHVATDAHFKKVKLEIGESVTEWTANSGLIASDRGAAKYGSCTTGNSAAKTVICDDFNLFIGAEITVTFTNYNKYAAPTLNVNSTGAIPIYFNGSITSAVNKFFWVAGTTITFRYDGTGWVPIGYPCSYYGSCADDSTTSQKLVTVPGAVICAGTVLNVKMASSHSGLVTIAPSSTSTTELGGTEAYPSDYVSNGSASISWQTGEVVQFTFDGEVWNIANISLRNHFWHDSDGAHIASSSSAANVLIDSDSIDIRDGTDVMASFSADGMELNVVEETEENGETVTDVVNVASFGKSKIELGKGSNSAQIKMCNDNVRFYASGNYLVIQGQKGITINPSSNSLWIYSPNIFLSLTNVNAFDGNTVTDSFLKDWVVETGSSQTPSDSRIGSGSCHWQKWASGKLEIWGQSKYASNVSFGNTLTWNGYVTPYLTVWGTWPQEATFVTDPDVHCRLIRCDTVGVAGDYILIESPFNNGDNNGFTPKTHSPWFKLWRGSLALPGNGSTLGAPQFSFHAVGRWK